ARGGWRPAAGSPNRRRPLAAEPAAPARQGTRRHPVGGQPDQEYGATAPPGRPATGYSPPQSAVCVGRSGGRPSSSVRGRATSRSPASNRTTLPVGRLQNTSARLAGTTAPMRRAFLLAYRQVPPGPVATPACLGR